MHTPGGTTRHLYKQMKTSYTNQNETLEPIKPWSSSDPHTHEDSSPKLGTGMPETSSVISITGQNHIMNW
jgi:hypothetical protein